MQRWRNQCRKGKKTNGSFDKLGVKVTKAMKRDTIIAKIELAESALEDETGEDETDNLV